MTPPQISLTAKPECSTYFLPLRISIGGAKRSFAVISGGTHGTASAGMHGPLVWLEAGVCFECVLPSDIAVKKKKRRPPDYTHN